MTTLVFPGQGSQHIGMSKDFYDNFEAAREIFNKVENTTKIKVKDIIFENEDNLLDITKYTQLSIFTTSMAIFAVFKELFGKTSAGLILPLISSHQKSVVPMGHNTILKKDDCITCLVRKEKMDVFHEWVASSPFSV